MSSRRVRVPYVFLGILTLGVGLGVGLGLSEGPITNNGSAEVAGTPCSAASNEAGLSCHLSNGAVSFLFAGPRPSKGALNCLVGGLNGAGTPASMGEVRRALGVLLPECERGSAVPEVPFVVQRGRASAQPARVNPRRRLIPYVLLGILTLGTGLAVGLGLAEGPLTYDVVATSLWAPCTIQRTGATTKVTCRSIVSNVTPSSFTWGSVGVYHFYETPPKMPADFATCTTSALVHVVPRIGPSRKMDASYDTCSESNDRL